MRVIGKNTMGGKIKAKHILWRQ